MNIGEKRLKLRLPAEWEQQTAVLLSWPHARTDWKPILPTIDKVYINLATAISQHAVCLIVTPTPERIKKLLHSTEARLSHIKFIKIRPDGIWIRDYGPITIIENGRPVHLDAGFNGWGNKYKHKMDDKVNRRLYDSGIFKRNKFRNISMILEGGSIECDGQGTLLVTSRCLLNPNRNPQLSKADIEAKLRCAFGIRRILWLDHGGIKGDDTDSHIDTLARFAADDTIVYSACKDRKDCNFNDLHRMQQQLQSFRTATNKPYKLIPLPWPKPKYDRKGNRMPATYANFLVINDAVLVPCYNDNADIAAMNVIAQSFPGRKVYGIDCLPLLIQHGSLHCATMQVKL